MLNPPLFPIEMTEVQIAAPSVYLSPQDLMHALKQVDESLKGEHEKGCRIARRYAKRKKKPYFVRFVMWPKGNWACMYDERFRDWPIAPGQYKTAYFSTCGAKKEHFYNLETNTTSDFIVST